MNNDAPELSPEARRIINEARGFDDPSPEDRARVKARWLAGVAAVAGVSSLTEAARAAGGLGWGLKAAGAALVLAAGAVGLNFLLPSDDAAEAAPPVAVRTAEPSGWNGAERARVETASPHEPEKSAELEAPAAIPQAVAPQAIAPQAITPRAGEHEPEGAVPVAPQSPSRVAQPVVAAPQAVAALGITEGMVAEGMAEAPLAPRVPRATAARSRAVKVPSPTPSAHPAPASAAPAPEASDPDGASGQLGEELSLLSEVRRSVQGGAPSRALELLSRYEARFGQPILGMEADALRVDALCSGGQREAARERARAFQNEWPGSPLERRVSEACP